MTSSWQLVEPVSAIIFDCDGTLSTIEGIDYLAEQNSQGPAVKTLTEQAMGKTGLTRELYQQRLNLVKPTQSQIAALGQAYFQQRVQDVAAVLQTLQRQHKSIYIVSAGIMQAVSDFASLLKVPRENVYAVSLSFDEKGNYAGFDAQSPMVTNTGKREIVEQLAKQHARMAYIGDGLNDLAVMDVVARFVGYGGAFYRENIAAHCDFYIRSASFAPLLPLLLTAEEQATCPEMTLYQQGLDMINQAGVEFSGQFSS